MEWMEWNREWNGMEWNGMEWTETSEWIWNGMEWTSLRQEPLNVLLK
jgi:hypothetical protein